MIISTLSPETLESHPVFPPFIVPKTPQAEAVYCCQSGGFCTDHALGTNSRPEMATHKETWVQPVSRESCSVFRETRQLVLDRLGAGQGFFGGVVT